MALGKKTGGRTKGTKNKRTLATESQIEALKQAGTDPKDYLIGVMAGTHEHDPHKVRAAEVLMEYMYSKLARMEVKGEIDATINVTLQNDLADQESEPP